MRVDTFATTNFRSIADSGVMTLGQMNLLVGRNNSGKSCVLRALFALQDNGIPNMQDIRIGADALRIRMEISDLNLLSWSGTLPGHMVPNADYVIDIARGSAGPATRQWRRGGSTTFATAANAIEPNNVVYPFFTQRKVARYEETINQSNSLEVRENLTNLAAKVDRLSDENHPAHDSFRSLVKEVINLLISAIASPGGKQVGMWVNNAEWIPLSQMGDGVAQMLGLIVQLCVADGKLFLIEELENDIHPEGLKALLRVIEERSTTNQFVISTHSNIVLRYLGSLPQARIFEVTNELRQDSQQRLPFTSIDSVRADVETRTKLLASLGYELTDLDLYEGWIIFEESSAEKIVRDYLIPWFAPRLRKVRTLAASGTSDLEPSFEAISKLVLFSHLEHRYKGRTVVLADNEPSGQSAIRQLKERFSDWPDGSFQVLSKANFEDYYPAIFAEQVQTVLAITSKAEKREQKRALLHEVLAWMDDNPEEARLQFEINAADVIQILQSVEAKL